jgi:hypothetical protein
MPQPLLFDLRGKRVYVTGHNGLAGSASVVGYKGNGLARAYADFLAGGGRSTG